MPQKSVNLSAAIHATPQCTSEPFAASQTWRASCRCQATEPHRATCQKRRSNCSFFFFPWRLPPIGVSSSLPFQVEASAPSWTQNPSYTCPPAHSCNTPLGGTRGKLPSAPCRCICTRHICTRCCSPRSSFGCGGSRDFLCNRTCCRTGKTLQNPDWILCSCDSCLGWRFSEIGNPLSTIHPSQIGGGASGLGTCLLGRVLIEPGQYYVSTNSTTIYGQYYYETNSMLDIHNFSTHLPLTFLVQNILLYVLTSYIVCLFILYY